MCAVITVGLMIAAGVSAANASAASTPAPTFSAHASAEQVYVTGLAPSAQMSLVTPSGKVLYTQRADSLGGLLFRNVPPGSGYRVRLSPDGVESGPLTVQSDRPAPWDPGIYSQSIPDNAVPEPAQRAVPALDGLTTRRVRSPMA